MINYFINLIIHYKGKYFYLKGSDILKIVSEYFLGENEETYKNSLNKAIHILEIKGYDELAKNYKEITKNRYNIQLN
ncbi:hypothetical protein [Senegalia massiliensis]|uniref:Uncharacterized protein n=1 Tax=Senegalia massiliensis TaxID=1720316 RepID=A0A845QW35_9CLOT|nr:hypothetical protein [Senegalia massiliensis]NBI06471.1 hypothetical protein [Senegalia massiliensis]